MLSCFCLSTSCTSHVAVPVLHRCLKPNCNESECSWSPQMSKVQRSNSLRIREELAIARKLSVLLGSLLLFNSGMKAQASKDRVTVP